MSWSTVPSVAASVVPISSVADFYVERGYLVDDYILAESAWQDVTPASPSWTVVP